MYIHERYFAGLTQGEEGRVERKERKREGEKYRRFLPFSIVAQPQCIIRLLKHPY